jgi:hypothetical protein
MDVKMGRRPGCYASEVTTMDVKMDRLGVGSV